VTGQSLFVYGTLRFAPIVEALLGWVPPMSPATVHGWRAAALPGRVYPGLVPAPGRTCDAVVLSGLRWSDRKVLDVFEGDPYEARELVLADGRRAVAYLWRDTSDVTAEDWDPDAFAAAHLDYYVRRCRGWRRSTADPPP